MLNYLFLLVDLVYTKLLYRRAKLVRIPFFSRGLHMIDIGIGFKSGRFCRFDVLSQHNILDRVRLVIGDNVCVGDRVHIAVALDVFIEQDVLIASNVFISDHDHGTSKKDSLIISPISRPLSCSPVRIGHSCWIGQNVCILKGVTIGHNSVVAAGAVVTKSCDPFSILMGIPARSSSQAVC